MRIAQILRQAVPPRVAPPAGPSQQQPRSAPELRRAGEHSSVCPTHLLRNLYSYDAFPDPADAADYLGQVKE